jgi:hypothetical protein
MTLPKLLVLLSPEGDAAARELAEHCARIRDAYDITILGTRERRATFEGYAYKNFRPSGIFGMGSRRRPWRLERFQLRLLRARS